MGAIMNDKNALLRDLWLAYEMQIVAMNQASREGKKVTSSLHSRMAEQLLETYFDVIEKVVYEPR